MQRRVEFFIKKRLWDEPNEMFVDESDQFFDSGIAEILTESEEVRSSTHNSR